MADQRNALHAYLTPESHEAWHTFSAEHGVSVSGMLEAYGLQLLEIVDGRAKIDDDLDDLVRTARKIDAKRRRRRRD